MNSNVYFCGKTLDVVKAALSISISTELYSNTDDQPA